REPGTVRPHARAAYSTAKPVVVAVARTVALFGWALALRLARELATLVRAAGDQVRDHKRQRDLRRDQQAEQGQEQHQRLPERLLAAGRRRRSEAPRPQLEQGMAELARRLRRLEQLAGRLPRRTEPRGSAAVGGDALHMRDAELEHSRALAKGYL